MEVRDSEKRKGWMRPAPRQKKGQRVFFLPPTTNMYRFIQSDVYMYLIEGKSRFLKYLYLETSLLKTSN
ncbi:hypothetical protein HMPREF0083_03850 [Aneurinibacillus aneurinilyticus ATCC 12856]|uniref:Uncharacterized protein n=1 Tax=Aneurinibacillus aneurinilyticus ATCC 12856 TaxID=649747 RepID=U1WHK5_ANEAE|nr:hypothetical protein HMPREF0083_03850 [Aneurinibacillus aneurinilyticus ATCC 12856]